MRRKITNLLQDNANYKFFVNMFKNSNFEHNSSHLNNNIPFLLDSHQQPDKLEDVYSDRGFNFINTESRKNKILDQNTFNLTSMLSKLNSLKSVKSSLYQKIDRSFSTTPEREILPSKKAMHTGGDFADVVTGSSIFVDKSLFVKEIIEDSSKVILITMPRRWGKSLNLDTLKRFLSVEEEQKELNKKLFAGGEIQVQQGFTTITKQIQPSKLVTENPDALNIQGQFPVIFIDFKDCKGGNFEKVKFNLNKKITDTIENFGYLALSEKTFSGLITIGQKYSELLSNTKSGIFKDTIKDLSSLLYSYHDKKAWILIDEYDAAANQAYLEFNDEEAKQVSELFRGIFESALKGNEHLEKGVMIGVQYIVKSGMLSGLNNLSKYNVTSTKYSKYYGINQEEMDLLLEHFGIDESKAARIKDWYNGYQSNIGTAEEPNFIDKYNIWSVVNYLNKQPEGFKSYWENHSLGNVINKEILKNPIIKNIVEGLINNNHLVLTNLTSDFNIDDFNALKSILNKHDQINIKQDGIDLLFSYLFITGYLTNALTTNKYSLPNKEIKIEFETKLKDYYNQIFNISPAKFNKLTETLTEVFSEKTTDEIVHIFKTEFGVQLTDLISTLELYDDNKAIKGAFKNEDLMHSLLNNIAIQIVNAKFASERYTTKPDGTKGRADIVLEKNNCGVVIEMKYKGTANEALEQAKGYAKLVEDTNIQIFIGCNITDQQEVFLSGDIIVDGNTPIHFDYP
jgi:hypothetical protein